MLDKGNPVKLTAKLFAVIRVGDFRSSSGVAGIRAVVRQACRPQPTVH